MKTKNNIAIVIGHDMQSPGKYSQHLHASEYMYNSEVASYLHPFDVYKRPLGGGYMTQMRTLAAELKPKNYDLIIELHFNAFNNLAQGCETVSYPGNDYTKRIGEAFCERISKAYGIKNRGAKIGAKKEPNGRNGRGWGFLSLMPAPAIILEPFFGDQHDCTKFENEAVYADHIKELLKCQL